MNFFERVYNTLPFPLQNLACSLRSLEQRRLRYGGQFYGLLKWLNNSQWWDSKQIYDYQLKNLRRVLSLAVENVPFYRNMLAKDFHPEDIKYVSDLVKIPILKKEDLRTNLSLLVNQSFSKGSLILNKTSGTTGKSLSLYLEPEAIHFRWAIWWRHRQRFGIPFNSPYATFTGLAAVPLDCKSPPFWRENRLLRQTIFNMHHLNRANLRSIVERLNKGGFTYYSGYPSILFSLASLMHEERLELIAPPKIIFTGAEALTSVQKNFIESVFHAPVSDLYGFSEGAGNASKCELGLYHEDFEYGILECYKPEILEGGLYRGEILATGFASSAMPLLRYQVGDVGIWKKAECACGRKTKTLVAIEGRSEDYVVLPEGTRIRRFDYIFKEATNVLEAQIIQKKLGTITIKIVKRGNYSDADEKQLREAVGVKISRLLDVEFEYVSEIPREANGKFRAVKSLINEKSGPNR